MARVRPWTDGDPIEPGLLAAILKRRNGQLNPLDRLLMRSEPLAAGWNTLLGQIRGNFALPIEYRELIMCRVAMLNGAEFEWDAHLPIYLSAGGTDAKADALRLPGIADIFDAKESALIALTDQSTRGVQVEAGVIDTLKSQFGEVQAVEAVATVAAYNMVSRFLVALGI